MSDTRHFAEGGVAGTGKEKLGKETNTWKRGLLLVQVGFSPDAWRWHSWGVSV